MTFNSMRYHKRSATFHNCADCDKAFEEEELVYVKKTYHNHVVAYLCEGCYESKYIEV